MRAAASRLLVTAILAAGLAGCSDEEGEPRAEGPCEAVSNPAPKEVDPGRPPAKPPAGRLTAKVETSCGTFEVALDTRESPKTTASFVHLAESGVYDETPIHRIAIQPPVVQGGDPQGAGFGDAGYTVDEPPPPDTSYERGDVAMAKSSNDPPGRSGSQFFVVTAAAALPPDYATLGTVSKGFGVVETITQYGDPSGQTEDPLEPVVVHSVTIEKR